ncbi:MAG TPA: ATP-binding protein [Trueperaceae bacterium]|nr:ATP-binding protein [Trueperaceae bacterium]
MTRGPVAGIGAWLDALDEGVVLMEEGRVTLVNRAAARFLEVAPERAVGEPLIRVLRDHRLEDAVASGRTVELETRGRRLQAVPVEGALLLLDLTALRRAQEDARELLAVLSHELRTPVTAIRATLEALDDDLPEALRRRFVRRARDESARLVRLLEDLTVEVRPPRERSLVLAEVVERAVAVVQPSLRAHAVRLSVDVPGTAVWADEDKLLQVLINLLENAAVHGPDGGRVHLQASPAERLVRLEVSDEGQPLDPSRVPQLFEPHARADGVKAKGTGLGLYIVRSIAERWGGQAWGGPAPDGAGNVFGVSVPLARLPGERG